MASTTLTIKSAAIYATEQQWSDGSEPASEQLIPPGSVVKYLGHVVGGMARVLHDGQRVVIHPRTTIELS